MSRYELHPLVWQDIRRIWECIADHDAADRVEAELFAAFEVLAQNPGLGRVRPDLGNKGLLFWVVRNHLIAYERRSKPLTIVMVIHGARQPERIGEILAMR